MGFMYIRSLKRCKKTGIKFPGIFALIFIMLILASGSGFAEETEKSSAGEVGNIDQITDDAVVVDDCLFNLSPGVKFYTNSTMNTYANRSSFRKGTKVGYLIDDNGHVTALWLER